MSLVKTKIKYFYAIARLTLQGNETTPCVDKSILERLRYTGCGLRVRVSPFYVAIYYVEYC